jgi:hypothetical protein
MVENNLAASQDMALFQHFEEIHSCGDIGFSNIQNIT